jgi:hypothetical protein
MAVGVAGEGDSFLLGEQIRAMLSGKQEQYDGRSMGIFRGVG